RGRISGAGRARRTNTASLFWLCRSRRGLGRRRHTVIAWPRRGAMIVGARRDANAVWKIAGVLRRLSALELARPQTRRPVFTTGKVDRLMRAASRIRKLGDGVVAHSRASDVAIDMAREKDGALVVFPAAPA